MAGETFDAGVNGVAQAAPVDALAAGDSAVSKPKGALKAVQKTRKRKPTSSAKRTAGGKKAAVKASRVKAPASSFVQELSGSMDKNAKVVLGVIAVIIIAVIIFYSFGSKSGGNTAAPTLPSGDLDVVASGDFVIVDYIGKFENGTVFDTSYPDLAQQYGIFNPMRNYTPLAFVVGNGDLIPGFEEAVLGMRVGKEKTFTLPPEKAYGNPDENLVQALPRKQVSPRVQNVTVERFRTEIGVEPRVGVVFRLPNPQSYEVNWPMTILAVSNDTVTFRYDPEENTTIATVFGETRVTTTADSIILVLNPTVGVRVVTLYGPARIIGVNETSVILDFNSILAGKTLVFTAKIENIVRGAVTTTLIQ